MHGILALICFLRVANLRIYFLRTKQKRKKNRKISEPEMNISERQ
ncbi:hypothetical protein HMPREF9999_01261 [Alloprevotella sp. oral taxon 473 str. F0040]|nr:hypothetical protein HMPREF9999_01261 [Alloprevotella sp. oral taxon 473 str. F0040]